MALWYFIKSYNINNYKLFTWNHLYSTATCSAQKVYISYLNFLVTKKGKIPDSNIKYTIKQIPV